MTNEQIEAILDGEKGSKQTILINGFTWDFLDIFQVLNELLELRQEVDIQRKKIESMENQQ